MAEKEPLADTTSDSAPKLQLVKHGPMMAAPGAGKTEDLATAPIVSRGSKKIAPVSAAAEEPSAAASPFDTIPTDEERATATEQPAEDAAEDSKLKATSQKSSSRTSTKKADDTQPATQIVEDTDTEPAASTEQAEPEVSGTVGSQMSSAETVRQAELEKLIAARTYAAPISTGKSSRALVGSLSIVALVLLVVLGDIWLDMGLLHISGVPHTHFFAAKPTSSVSTPVVTTSATPAPRASTVNQSQLNAKMTAIVDGLELYHVSQGGYPAKLVASDFPDIDPVDTTPPAGVSYLYKAAPTDCNAGSKVCTSFTLTAVDNTTHKTLLTKHSV